MKKIYIVLFIILICCGCTAKYDLKINKDLSVSESITGLENDKFYNYFSVPKSKVIDLTVAPYRSYLEVQKYSRNEFSENSLYGATFSKKYNSLDDYVKYSSIYRQYFDNLDIKNDNNIISISVDNPLGANANFSNRIIVDEGTISIVVPFKVLENNADKVDKRNNVYYWNFNSSKANKIFIKFDSKKNADGGNLNFKVAIVSIVILSLGIFVVYRIYRKKNNQRNDF